MACQPTFRSLRRQKIELTKGRAKQTENALMKRLQPQNLCLPAGCQANVQKINPLKALKNPAHGRTVGGLVDLVGNSLLALLQALAQALFSEAIDQQTEHHNEAEGDQTAWLLHEDGGSQEENPRTMEL